MLTTWGSCTPFVTRTTQARRLFRRPVGAPLRAFARRPRAVLGVEDVVEEELGRQAVDARLAHRRLVLARGAAQRAAAAAAAALAVRRLVETSAAECVQARQDARVFEPSEAERAR